MPREKAVVYASRVRLRPILMTALTTILGLVPMAVLGGEGAELRAPMAITVMGGLTVSTFLTLVVIPTIYLGVLEASERLFKGKKRQ
jgi:HAE1 family hydrophobic/amphiphilic exporter-1